ncbi:nitrate reductase subunit beta [Algoriphagus persicinus]|uniref:nitrate reductase subunit beta n=1 Tax=Algoriphagus persicinus TaxID=3108754 RepID=UPI002B3C06FF|nr:nitrate reductase subunit beta [Algoriphagus sp. E1-3-M2]MEB2785325.1 nitrate reductase subunit beta [Algoriphagus sp. E1-3-M2]
MNIRSQISMVFHLDKCIGCHTCSIACKNIWTDRKGAEYMWWNNVETKPGTGYPTKWEDQDIYKGGWEKNGNSVSLKGAGKLRGLKNIFHNPHLPVLEDYYEPWTYKYEDLFNAPEGDDQPTARPISLVTGEPIDVKSGPNWDDDLGGSPDYARHDVNFKDLSAAEQESLFQLERMTFHYLPRICNHCLNPACVGSCPSGAIYKRGEDGVVLINQERCRAWRMCVTACPYKKSYFNWSTGKSEKCILCYPRLESGQAPACMHSCVGRIRYLGVMLYDADKIHDVASCDEDQLVDAQLDIYLDPFDPEVIRQATENGIADSTIKAAQESPVYKFVKKWKIALPLHPEFRTIPNLFYVPPMLPAMASVDADGIYDSTTESLWAGIEKSRLPMKYLASLFTAGNEEKVKNVLKKLLGVKIYRRDVTVGDLSKAEVEGAMSAVHMDAREAEDIYRLTSLATFEERFVIPPAHREESIEMIESVADTKGDTGFGFKNKPARGL